MTTSHTLTPYDTGDRLEPAVWVADGVTGEETPRVAVPDDFGRVDFNDDENATIATLYIERTPTGYTLHVDADRDQINIQFDN